MNTIKEMKLDAHLISIPVGGRSVLFTAIRTAYSPEKPRDIWLREFDRYEHRNSADGLEGTDVDRLFRSIVGRGHTSVLEHLSYTFAISGVSRALLAQLTRHRIGFSPTVQSQRYVGDASEGKKGGFDIIVPATIKSNIEALILFQDINKDIQRAYNRIRAAGIPKEDARAVLPNAASTNMTLTVNLRAFLNFYELRHEKGGAQAEIKELAEKMKSLLIDANPWLDNIFNIYFK